MPLSSALFRGNRALEACAVQDSAHVTHGAHGDHVARIQFALSTLDGLVIARTELAGQQYGGSTAAAVLAYKKKRAIINRSYQNAPDDIVGKMTIASLDREMRATELRPRPPGDCAIAPTGAPVVVPSRKSRSSRKGVAAGARGAKTAAPLQPRGIVRIFVQVTQRSSLETRFPLAAHVERARDCMAEHGLTLSVEFGSGTTGFSDVLRFTDEVLSSAVSVADNVDQLRKVSEDARPGLPGILRVIVCPMIGDDFGDTFRNRFVGGRRVPPFVLLNSRLDDQSRATLIHEMIHASKDGGGVHDPERSSVFFKSGTQKQGEVTRSALRKEHADSLATLSATLVKAGG